VVSCALLRGVVTRTEGEAVAALDAALRAHLLEEAGADGYRFAHGVIREVVEDDLGAARRALLHRRVAETLERALGAPPVEALAYHYGQGGVRDKAALYAEQAGDRAWAQFAHAAAEGHYRDAADHLDAQDRPPRRSRRARETGRGAAHDGAIRRGADRARSGGRGVPRGR